jgi:hypothetical protein
MYFPISMFNFLGLKMTLLCEIIEQYRQHQNYNYSLCRHYYQTTCRGFMFNCIVHGLKFHEDYFIAEKDGASKLGLCSI